MWLTGKPQGTRTGFKSSGTRTHRTKHLFLLGARFAANALSQFLFSCILFVFASPSLSSSSSFLSCPLWLVLCVCLLPRVSSRGSSCLPSRPSQKAFFGLAAQRLAPLGASSSGVQSGHASLSGVSLFFTPFTVVCLCPPPPVSFSACPAL